MAGAIREVSDYQIPLLYPVQVDGGAPFIMQPKRQFAEVVRDHEIPVPKLFPTLEDALASGGPFIIRSEHPQDLDGASGIVGSFFVRPEDITTAQERKKFFISWDQLMNNAEPGAIFTLAAQLMAHLDNTPQDVVERVLTRVSQSEILSYCLAKGLNPEDFNRDISYSYWEGLPGVNWSIAADPAVRDRYHLFAAEFEPSNGLMPVALGPVYRVVEKGNVVAGEAEVIELCGDNPYLLPLKEFARGDINVLRKLIEFYENVRAVFDPDHCFLMEAQQGLGDNRDRFRFLQLLMLHDFAEPEFALDLPLQKGEMEAVYVRGATPPEGVDVLISSHPEPYRNNPTIHTGVLPFTEVGLLEANVRDVPVQVVPLLRTGEVFSPDSSHISRSIVLKTGVTVVPPQADILFTGITPDARGVKRAKIRVVSDGVRAIFSQPQTQELQQ